MKEGEGDRGIRDAHDGTCHVKIHIYFNKYNMPTLIT